MNDYSTPVPIDQPIPYVIADDFWIDESPIDLDEPIDYWPCELL